MIERDHTTAPVRIFSHGESWDYYRFVKPYRSCWIWHVQMNAERKVPSELWYAVSCPDGTYYFAKNMKDAQIIAGRWSNGLYPRFPEEAEVIL